MIIEKEYNVRQRIHDLNNAMYSVQSDLYRFSQQNKHEKNYSIHPSRIFESKKEYLDRIGVPIVDDIVPNKQEIREQAQVQ